MIRALPLDTSVESEIFAVSIENYHESNEPIRYLDFWFLESLRLVVPLALDNICLSKMEYFGDSYMVYQSSYTEGTKVTDLSGSSYLVLEIPIQIEPYKMYQYITHHKFCQMKWKNFKKGIPNLDISTNDIF